MHSRFYVLFRKAARDVHARSSSASIRATLSRTKVTSTILRHHKRRKPKNVAFFGASYNDADLMFAHADGSAEDPRNFGRAVPDCITRPKVIPKTLHVLWDTHASLCTKAGVPIEVISNRLGRPTA